VLGGQSSFARIYLGEPAFANLSLGGLGERLLGYLHYRAYLVLPALFALFWAVRARNPYIVLGHVAFLPWGLLQLIADSPLAGTLSGYYAYPFMIAAFWPLLGVVAEGSATQPRAGVTVLAFTAMIAVSLTALGKQYDPGGIALPTAFVSPPSLARQATTEAAISELVRSKAELGAVFVDGSVLALAPAAYGPDETVRDAGDRRPNTVIYFAAGYEADRARSIAAAARLDWRYEIRGTSVRLETDRSIDPASPLAALLASAAPVN
jgi:hypothetical protein